MQAARAKVSVFPRVGSIRRVPLFPVPEAPTWEGFDPEHAPTQKKGESIIDFARRLVSWEAFRKSQLDHQLHPDAMLSVAMRDRETVAVWAMRMERAHAEESQRLRALSPEQRPEMTIDGLRASVQISREILEGCVRGLSAIELEDEQGQTISLAERKDPPWDAAELMRLIDEAGFLGPAAVRAMDAQRLTPRQRER